MGFFTSKEEKELDEYLDNVRMNMANNYKDEARENFQKFQTTLDSFEKQGALKPKKLAAYREKESILIEKLKDYSHKDQKPYWN